MPRPVRTTAPTASSPSAARRAAVTSWYMVVSKALRTSGRLKAMTRTPGAASSLSIRLYGMAAAQASVSPAAARRRMTVSAAPLTPVERGQPM